MRLLSIFTVFLILCSCNTDKKSKDVIEKREVIDKALPTRGELSRDSQLLLGQRLFSEKTCVTCHDVFKKKIGPSIKEIMMVYKKENADIVAFLKGNAEPIVDTTASQVAIMQANIDGFLQNISDEELKTIATYMLHIDELNPE